jgi:REP element-mobilizing transposase RayT
MVIKTKHVHCCWNYPTTFNMPSTCFVLLGPLSNSMQYKQKHNRFYTWQYEINAYTNMKVQLK